MQFDNLTDDCIGRIFAQIPIRELLPLRAISRRCKVTIENVLRASHSLKLFPDLDNGMKSYFNELIYSYNLQDDRRYTQQTSDLDVIVGKGLASTDKSPDLLPLSALLPNLTNILIFYQKTVRKYPSNLTNLRELLFRWQRLQSLTIFNLPSGCVGPIASMANLIRLELFNINLDHLRPLEPLSEVMGQLEHFTIGKCTQLVQPINSVTKNTLYKLLSGLNSDRLKRLSLNRVNITLQELRRLFNANPELARNLTHLTLVIWKQGTPQNSAGTPFEMVELIAVRCVSLTFLQISYADQRVPLSEYFTELSRLHHLAELKLFTYYLWSSFGDRNSAEFARIRRIRLDLIRHLHLSITSLDNVIHAAPVFPFLERLSIAHTSDSSTRNEQERIDREIQAIRVAYPTVSKFDIYLKGAAEMRFMGPHYGSKCGNV